MGMFDFITGDTSGSTNQYAGDIDQLRKGYDPYIQAGQSSLKDLMSQYRKQIDNPNFLTNQLSQEYNPSAYAQVQTRNLKNELNNNAAATGSLGGSYSALTMGRGLQDLVSRDENQYIDRGTNMYNQGIAGEQGINTMGYDATGQSANLGLQAAQARMKAAQDSQSSLMNTIGGVASMGANFLTGGQGGIGGLIGGLGKKIMPTSFTSMFQAPSMDSSIGSAIETMRKYNLMPSAGGYVPGSGTPPYRAA